MSLSSQQSGSNFKRNSSAARAPSWGWGRTFGPKIVVIPPPSLPPRPPRSWVQRLFQRSAPNPGESELVRSLVARGREVAEQLVVLSALPWLGFDDEDTEDLVLEEQP